MINYMTSGEIISAILFSAEIFFVFHLDSHKNSQKLE